jgi:predicted RNA-binding Zn-ribbon protein involved in translation (DUF1610 family)
MKYTKELLESVVKDCVSISALLRKLGIKETGGSHKHISNRLKQYNIDVSHMLGKSSCKGKQICKLHWSIILIKRDTGSRNKAYILRRSLIAYGKNYICEKCGNDGNWLNKILILQVHHKNGDWLDDRAENLSFLCPNCHSQETKRSGEGNQHT